MKRFLALIICIFSCVLAVSFTACGDYEGKNGTVSVKYYASGADMLPLLKKGELTIGLLPEPAATQLTNISDKTWYRLDVQELYDSQLKSYPQAVMLVKESLLASKPQLVNAIASEFETNVAWVKSNPAQAVNAVNGALAEGVTASLKAPVITSQVVDNCKIYWQSAQDAKEQVKDYIDTIIEIDENAGAVVNDDLFYNGTASGSFDKGTIKVIAPDGAPALAIAKFIYDNQTFGTNKTFEYSVVASTNIGGAVAQGTGDIVIIPVNAASKLYKAKGYKMVSVVTHGNLYLMSTEKIESVLELKDKTIGVIGQGLVPDLTFKAILKDNLMLTNPA